MAKAVQPKQVVFNVVRRRHPADRFIDDISIRTEERWKSSGISGSEWRFGFAVELKRKGRVMFRGSFGSINYATAAASAAVQLSALELDLDSNTWTKVTDDDPDLEVGTCCQPGCKSRRTVVWYRMKQEFDRTCSFSRKLDPDEFWYREFCKEHADRGSDAGLDDGPTNYIKLSESPEQRPSSHAGSH